MPGSVGTAYLTISPKFDGLSRSVENALGDVGESAGEKHGQRFSGGFATKVGGLGKAALAAVGAAGTAITGTLVKSALEGYARSEQLVGGIETLYGSAAKTVQENAATAYRRVGMSANDYMETATSFAATLRQAVGGDLQKAAEQSDKALQQMSDNANKMGTDMSSVQNAFQGFAKQNYTMLDNLKLGYGGTKQEMQRLLDDAEALTGIHYDIDNFSDVIDAIGVIQDQLGITGTTAAEAAGTVEGSIGTMKSAWDNWVSGLMDDDADVGQLTDNLLDAIGDVADNVGPRLAALGPAIGEGLPKLVDGVLPYIPKVVGPIADGAVKAFTGLLGAALQSAPIPTLLAGAFGGFKVVSAVKPALEGLPGLFKGMTKAAGKLPGLLASAATGLADLAISAGSDRLMSGAAGLEKFSNSLKGMSPAALTGAVAGIAAVVAAVAIAAAGTYEAWKRQRDYNDAISGFDGASFAASLDKARGGVSGLDEATWHAGRTLEEATEDMNDYRAAAEGIFDDAAQEIVKAEGYAQTIRDLGDGGSLTAEEYEKLKSAVDGFNKSAGTSYEIVSEVNGQGETTYTVVEKTADGYRDASDSIDDYMRHLEARTRAEAYAQAATEAMKEELAAKKDYDAAVARLDDLEAAYARGEMSMQEYEQAVEAQGVAIDNQKAHWERARAEVDELTTAQYNNQAIADGVATEYNELAAQFTKVPSLMKEMGLSSGDLDEALGILGLTAEDLADKPAGAVEDLVGAIAGGNKDKVLSALADMGYSVGDFGAKVDALPTYHTVTFDVRDHITSFIDGLRQKFAGLPATASTTFEPASATGSVASSPYIPRHAAGYIATGPTLTNNGWIGEDGIEAALNWGTGGAVVPLTNTRYMLPIADAIAEGMAARGGRAAPTVNMTVVQQPGEDVETFARRVVRELEWRL